VGLKHRLADVSYWVYDHARHEAAFAAAEEPSTAPDFQACAITSTYQSEMVYVEVTAAHRAPET
jgi:hypothetical protein